MGLGKLDQEIDVAVRPVEIGPGGRAKQLQAPGIYAPTSIADILTRRSPSAGHPIQRHLGTVRSQASA